MKFLESLSDFADIIEGIEIIQFIEEEHISKLKLKIRLIDASSLWVREVRNRETLVAYSYYWLKSDNSIITGWDNAPHHREVKTFPHHRHVGKKIESSHQTNLKEVLEYIKTFFT